MKMKIQHYNKLTAVEVSCRGKFIIYKLFIIDSFHWKCGKALNNPNSYLRKQKKRDR